MASNFVNGNKPAFAYEKLETMAASTPLTATVYKQAKTTQAPFDRSIMADEAYITIETADVRCTFDGTVPTVSAGTGAGHLFGHGDTITLSGFENIQKFRCINAVAANGAVLRASYFTR